MPRPETPLLAVDIVIEASLRPPQIVLVERRYGSRGLALPGGYVQVGESLEDAVRRQARENTGFDVEVVALLGCYSDPTRDHWNHTVSVGFLTRVRGHGVPHGTSHRVALCDPAALPPLAFDHARIIEDYRRYRQMGPLPHHSDERIAPSGPLLH